MKRGHRYGGATFARDWSRHFDSPSVPAPPAVTAAPRKTDAEIEKEATEARLAAQRRRGRRSTMLTTGNEPDAPTSSGSITTPGSGKTLG